MNASIDENTTNAVAQRTAWLLSVATNLIADKASANFRRNPSSHSFPQQQPWGSVDVLPSQPQLPRYGTNISTDATTVVISADSSIVEELSRDRTTVNHSGELGTISPEEEAERFLKKWRSASFSQDSEIPRRALQQVEIPNPFHQQQEQKVNCATPQTIKKMMNKKLQVGMSLKSNVVASTQTNELESVSTRCVSVNTLATVCPTTCTLRMDGAFNSGEAEGLRNFLKREIVGALRDEAMVEEAISLINLIWACIADLRTKCCTRDTSEISNNFKREIRDVNGGATVQHVILAVLADEKQCAYREAGTQTQINPLHEKAELERNIQVLQEEILALHHAYGEKEASYEHEIARLIRDQKSAEEMIEKLSDDIYELTIAHRAKIADEEKKRLSAEQHLRNRMEEWVKDNLESERIRMSLILERHLSLLDLDPWGNPLMYGERTTAPNLFSGSPQSSNCAMGPEKVKTHVSEANPACLGTPHCRIAEKTFMPLSIQREPREATTELMKLGDLLDAKWAALVHYVNTELSKEKLQSQHDFEEILIGIESQLSSIVSPVKPLSQHVDADTPRTVDISAVSVNIAGQIYSLRTQLEASSLVSKGLREALLVQSETHAEAILSIQNERTKALEMLKNELSASHMALRMNEILHSLADEEIKSRFESVATLEAVSFAAISKQFAREHVLLTHSCDKVSQTSDLLGLKRKGPVTVEETPVHDASTTARYLSYATPQTHLSVEHAARVTTPHTVRKNVTFAASVAGPSVDPRGKGMIDAHLVVSALGVDQRSSLLELLAICDEALSV